MSTRRKLKTAISFAFLAMLVCFLCALPLLAEPRLSLTSGRGFPGTTNHVNLFFQNDTNFPLAVVAIQADVVFDAPALVSKTPIPGNALQDHSFGSSEPTNGVRRVLALSANNLPLTNGVVAELPFAVAPGVYRNLPLTLTNVILVLDSASQGVSTNTSGGIAITQVYVSKEGLADGFFNIVTNGTEQCFLIEVSTNLIQWSTIATNATSEPFLLFKDPIPSDAPFRFYRAIPCPPPP